MKKLRLVTLVYLAVASMIIGCLTGGYLELINLTIAFFWQLLPTALKIPAFWQPVVICLPLSLLIGYMQLKIGAYPFTIEEVLTKTRLAGHFDYDNWWKILLNSLLVLGAGASVGPEAGASGLVAGMIYWLGCRYKVVMSQKENLSRLSCWQQLKAIASSRTKNYPAALAVPLAKYFKSPQYKKQLYGWGTAWGVLGLLLFFKLCPQEGVIGLHLPKVSWQWQAIGLVIPALLLGWLFGWVFVKLGKLGRKYLSDVSHKVLAAFAGGVLLAGAAFFSHDILFSGEFRIQAFAKEALNLPPLFLLLLGLLKALVSNLGFYLGWRGGTIFPAIFSSLAIGAALAQIGVWMPQLTATIVMTVALTVILERPLLVAILLWLLVPLQFALIVLFLAYLTSYLLKKLPVLKP